jgi:hypothetical protein
MPELTMLWKDYEANAATVATESKTISSQAGFTVEIRIPADLATTSNRQVLSGASSNECFWLMQLVIVHEDIILTVLKFVRVISTLYCLRSEDGSCGAQISTQMTLTL